MSAGGALMEGDSRLLDGPLGVVKIGFDGYDLGKTTEDTVLTPDQDIKDILFQQDGTKPSDHVRTGIEYICTAVFGEIKTSLLVKMMSGMESANTNPNSDSGTFNRSIYNSMRELEAKVLRIVAVDENGVPSTELKDTINFYEAIPIVNGDLINWGADTQRNLPMQFRIKYHLFSEGESSTKVGAFGYYGDPTTEDVPAVTWPDVAGPVLLSAAVSTATDLDLTFNENVALPGGSYVSGSILVKVNGEFIEAVSASVASAVATITFPASTFSAGDTVKVYANNLAIQDTESTPNLWSGEDNFPATNPLV